jgi:hypothetical protein
MKATFEHELVKRMIDEAVKAEREACAKLLERTDLGGLKSDVWLQNYTATILDGYAKAIRGQA